MSKRAKFAYEELVQQAEAKIELITQTYENFALPEKPDLAKVE